MEIRCSQCGHLGAAKEVRSVSDGVGLVCAECEHVNVASAGGDGAEETATDEQRTGGDTGRDPERDRMEMEIVESVERFLPQPGSGMRCRKCAHLFEREDPEHCPRCGLSVSEAESYAEGEAPWEIPPEGREEAFENARELWKKAVDGGHPEEVEEFVDHVIAAGLIDVWMRRVQHYLVDHPEDPIALDALRQLAKGLEVAIEVARTRAETKSEEFNDDVKRVRSGLMVGALIFWIAIFILFSWLFLGNV